MSLLSRSELVPLLSSKGKKLKKAKKKKAKKGHIPDSETDSDFVIREIECT